MQLSQNIYPKRVSKVSRAIEIPSIESSYDTRLVTLLTLIAKLAQDLALANDRDADLILAEHLYSISKGIYSCGEEIHLDKVIQEYPILRTVIE